eukprot:5641761-Pyramimonas_sp.AAC.1
MTWVGGGTCFQQWTTIPFPGRWLDNMSMLVRFGRGHVQIHTWSDVVPEFVSLRRMAIRYTHDNVCLAKTPTDLCATLHE